MDKEIEKKFNIINVPNLKKCEDIKVYKITQQYLYQDKFSAIRKRKIIDNYNKKSRYVYTVKTKGKIENKNSMYEIETNITEQEYNEIPDTNNIIEKIRIAMPINSNLTAELDIYYGKLEGFITVEVEFKDENEMKEFVKPEWFGKELDKNTFSNASLSIISREEFLNLISKKELEENLKIKELVEKWIDESLK